MVYHAAAGVIEKIGEVDEPIEKYYDREEFFMSKRRERELKSFTVFAGPRVTKATEERF